MTRVDAVIVNHNTSMFAELALRSLMATTAAGPAGACELGVWVVDNHSTDEQALSSLRAAVDELGATFELSRWPAEPSAPGVINTHGDVLRDWLRDPAHRDTEYVLLVDSDIDWETDGALQAMLAELQADESLWALQARFTATEATYGEGSSLVIWGGRPTKVQMASGTVDGIIQHRIHPGATLVRNSDVFRRLVDEVGLSCAVVVSRDTEVAGFYDTFALASHVMTVAGYRYALATTAYVHHFFMASYDKEHVDARESDCQRRMARFRRS